MPGEIRHLGPIPQGHCVERAPGVWYVHDGAQWRVVDTHSGFCTCRKSDYRSNALGCEHIAHLDRHIARLRIEAGRALIPLVKDLFL